MRVRSAVFLAAAAASLALSGRARATDAPHDLSASPGIDCNSCHIAHNAPGGALTTVSGNANLCFSCHNQAGVGARLGFPWSGSQQAVPGAGGSSHRWDAPGTSAAHGAQPPSDPEMAQRLAAGALQCSTCHDQHANVISGGKLHTSLPTSAEQNAAQTNAAGTGTFTLQPPGAAAVSKGYLVRIVSPGPVGASTFLVSHDRGATWFGWTGSAWSSTAGAGCPTGAAVPLDDPAVTVAFAGSFAVNDEWTFYVSYPFLRASDADSRMCEDCHLSRVQSFADVEGHGALVANGSSVFSHPVGVALNANGQGYDRAEPLDTNGVTQSANAGAGDGVVQNDLRLDSGGKVRCLTCHSPHNVSSNSIPSP